MADDTFSSDSSDDDLILVLAAAFARKEEGKEKEKVVGPSMDRKKGTTRCLSCTDG